MAFILMITFMRFGSIVGSNLVGAMLYTHCELFLDMAAVILIFCACITYYVLNKKGTVIENITK